MAKYLECFLRLAMKMDVRCVVNTTSLKLFALSLSMDDMAFKPGVELHRRSRKLLGEREDSPNPKSFDQVIKGEIWFISAL